jgi:hypothetical protein
MKTKLLFAVFCLAACLCGCSQGYSGIPPTPPPEPEPPKEEGCPFKFPPPVAHPLAGTQWKLVGSLDAAGGDTTTYLHPEECADCYTLSFDTDSTATFRNSIRDCRIDLFHLDTCLSLATEDIYNPDEKPEERDAKLAYGIMHAIASYAASSDTLLLYYHYGSINYLLFTKQEL